MCGTMAHYVAQAGPNPEIPRHLCLFVHCQAAEGGGRWKSGWSREDYTRLFFVRVQSSGGSLQRCRRSPDGSPLPGMGGCPGRSAGSMAAQDWSSGLLTGCLASNYTASELCTKLAAVFSVKGARETATFSRTTSRAEDRGRKGRAGPARAPGHPLGTDPGPCCPGGSQAEAGTQDNP